MSWSTIASGQGQLFLESLGNYSSKFNNGDSGRLTITVPNIPVIQDVVNSIVEGIVADKQLAAVGSPTVSGNQIVYDFVSDDGKAHFFPLLGVIGAILIRVLAVALAAFIVYKLLELLLFKLEQLVQAALGQIFHGQQGIIIGVGLTVITALVFVMGSSGGSD